MGDDRGVVVVALVRPKPEASEVASGSAFSVDDGGEELTGGTQGAVNGGFAA